MNYSFSILWRQDMCLRVCVRGVREECQNFPANLFLEQKSPPFETLNFWNRVPATQCKLLLFCGSGSFETSLYPQMCVKNIRWTYARVHACHSTWSRPLSTSCFGFFPESAQTTPQCLVKCLCIHTGYVCKASKSLIALSTYYPRT